MSISVQTSQSRRLELPVLSNAEQSRLDELKRALAGRFRGEIRFSDHDRALYSTDASIHQVMPLGVIAPADEADAQLVVESCLKLQVPLLPRGGGTSLAGQCTNRAVVLDLSPHLRQIEGLSPSERTLRAQAGATIEEINRYLSSQKCGLFFAPDPASQAQCTLGGCIGNNAAGARSVKYKRTSENLAAIDVLLATGERATFSSQSAASDPNVQRISREIAAIAKKYAPQIRERFPKTVRRNAGYGLDLILRQLDSGVPDDRLDLSGLICGSEGTLAVVLSAILRLQPIPAARGLAVVTFSSVQAAIDHVASILTTGPSAVELLDDVVLDAAAGNNECKNYLPLLSKSGAVHPKAVLYVEYETAGTAEELQGDFDKLRELSRSATEVLCYTDPAPIASLWALRKAAEPLLHQIGGGAHDARKPHTFVEDNAVPVERLSEFVRRFEQIVKRYGTTAAYYAHASVGVLHVRPLIDLHQQSGRDEMRAIALEVADLARECGGVMSGEHGDGRARGPLLEHFYGPELISAFREVKKVFDPQNLLNPGNIVDPGPVQSISENLRIDRQKLSAQLDSVDTYFDFSDQGGFASAIELCNGAGVCRKTSGGTMCPSYRATLDERHTTRGRGNALRLAITGQFSQSAAPAWDDPGTIETLHLCLSCKACKSECPSNVDVARLKAEYTAQRYRTTPPKIRDRLFANVRLLNSMGSIAPRMANWLAGLPPMRAMANRLLGLHPRRSLPPFGRSLRRWLEKRAPVGRQSESPRRVALFEDCFTGFNESQIGRAAVGVLEAFGYEVVLPRVGCCGRPAISMGLLESAVQKADATARGLLKCLDGDRLEAILFLEPSCLSAVKDDWLNLKLQTPLSDRKRLAEKSMPVEDFLNRQWESHPRRPVTGGSIPAIQLHAHCHQKALWGETECAASLRRIASTTVLATGCCGMAGSFGFTVDRYDLSMKIAESSLLPAMRGTQPTPTICAPGTSCRHQIHDGVNLRALHPIEIWAQAVGL
jgi:FAD/FMN-containing dehydrogenase/Fe-S oxidoreductase